MKKTILACVLAFVIFTTGIGYMFTAIILETDLSFSDEYITENVAAEFKSTLWETCSDVMDEYEDDRDIREVMFNVKKANNMTSQDIATLRPGRDVIIIPIRHKKSEQPVIGVTSCSM